MTNGEGEVICTCSDKEIAESFIKDVESVKDLLPNKQGELIDKLKQLRFFNQRAGRELWGDKPRDIQDKDIENADTILAMAISALSAEGEYIKKEDAISKILIEFTKREEKGKVACFCADVKQTCADILDGLTTYSFPDSAEDNTMEWVEDGCIVKCSACGEEKRFPHWITCPCCGRKAVQK